MGFGDGTDQSLVVGFIHRSEFGDGFRTQIREEWWLVDGYVADSGGFVVVIFGQSRVSHGFVIWISALGFGWGWLVGQTFSNWVVVVAKLWCWVAAGTWLSSYVVVLER